MEFVICYSTHDDIAFLPYEKCSQEEKLYPSQPLVSMKAKKVWAKKWNSMLWMCVYIGRIQKVLPFIRCKWVREKGINMKNENEWGKVNSSMKGKKCWRMNLHHYGMKLKMISLKESNQVLFVDIDKVATVQPTQKSTRSYYKMRITMMNKWKGKNHDEWE